MRVQEYRTLDVRMAEGGADSVQVRTPEPEATVTVDPWGVVTVRFGGREIHVYTQDCGPGGRYIYVEGPHEDGTP